MRLRGFVRSVLAGLTIFAFSGCFEDAKSSDTSGTSGGTDGCPAGSEGCDCYGNNSCDGGLECSADGKCLSPNCMPGEENCSCSNGLCLGELTCQDNVCKPGGGGTSSSTTGTTTNSTTDGTGSGSDTAPTASDTSPTDTNPTSDSVGTTGDSCQIMPMDDQCNMCVKDVCCAEFEACINESSCTCFLDCIGGGGDPGNCGFECGNSQAFPDLDQCVQGECEMFCGDNQCGLPDGVQECTACAGNFCCDELQLCLQDPDCQCIEGCMAQANIPEDDCVAQCGVQDIGSVPFFPELKQCAVDNNCQDTGLGVDCYG